VAKRALERIELSREAARLEEEQRRTLFDLSTEKSRTRSIVEALPNGVMVTNSNGQVVLMNDAVKRHLNLDPGCEIGQRVEDYVADEGLCNFVHEIPSTCRGEQEEPSCELSMGEDKHLLVKASPILGDEQEYLGSVVVFADISPIKKLDRLKSEFVAKVSHELRSPLSTIHEQMALVIQDMLEQEQADRDQQILSRMQERTRGLIKLVEDLLDLSRLEAGAAYQEPQDVSIQELLPRLVDMLQDQAGEKEQTLELIMADESFQPVHADPNALECVFNNLISNAIKYSPEGGHVRVRLEAADSTLLVHVDDNGFGISPEDQERIFERFYRVKNEKTRFITGSGLGLPIVKGILDDLGGRISVHSEPGQGSTFTVTLPTVQ
jgi:PAS domain S-box-containing protein